MRDGTWQLVSLSFPGGGTKIAQCLVACHCATSLVHPTVHHQSFASSTNPGTMALTFSSASASDSTPSTTIAIVITAVVLFAVIITIIVSLFGRPRDPRNAEEDLERQDAKNGTSSAWSGLFTHTWSLPAEPELPRPVLQILPHLRPRRQRILNALMFWRKPKHPEPFTVADVLKAKLDVQTRAQADTVRPERAESAGWWKISPSKFNFGRAAIVPEIVVCPFHVSRSDAPSSATVSLISSPVCTTSAPVPSSPLTPLFALSPFPATVSLFPAELQAHAVPTHITQAQGRGEKPTLPTQVGRGIVPAGVMSTASSAADISHDSSDSFWDLTITHSAGVEHSVSLHNLDLSVGRNPSFLAAPHVGSLTPGRSTGFVVPSRSSTRFGTFVETLRSEAAARIATGDSVYFDCSPSPSES
ncbi:hypothetical protein C8T65DRAFT_167401 [Cerioporus squamosus]|nr:hypothetical protein C8T65DRAFT_167401 [Cerioporus squamosus]